MKHRIVLATDSLDPSGMGEHMLTLGGAIQDAFDIVLAAPDEGPSAVLLRRAAALGLGVKTFDLHQLGHWGQWLQEYRADLVHVHAGIGWEGHGLVRHAKGAGASVVRTEHLPYLLTSVVQQAEYRAMLRAVDQRIAVSQAVAQSHAGWGAGKIDVIPNGIFAVPPRREPRDVRAELGLAEGEQMILTVARFTAQKGYDLLVAAARAVLSGHPKARFLLVGDGPELDGIRSAIASQNLGKSITATGARSDVPDLLASADLFVLPSHFEGLPLALLEAMAASAPIVATANGGTVEALGSKHPFLVPPGDSNALSKAINLALADRATAHASAAAARARFTALFSAERMAQQTAALYRSILSTTIRRGAAA